MIQGPKIPKWMQQSMVQLFLFVFALGVFYQLLVPVVEVAGVVIGIRLTCGLLRWAFAAIRRR